MSIERGMHTGWYNKILINFVGVCEMRFNEPYTMLWPTRPLLSDKYSNDAAEKSAVHWDL